MNKLFEHMKIKNITWERKEYYIFYLTITKKFSTN